MNLKTRMKLLGIYDLGLALGAIYIGIAMLKSDYGEFASFPKEWSYHTPFQSWVVPGIIFLLFSLGNIVAAAASFTNKEGRAWIASALIGTAFLICLIVQIVMVNEWYLATIELLILSIVQLVLSLFVAVKKKDKML